MKRKSRNIETHKSLKFPFSLVFPRMFFDLFLIQTIFSNFEKQISSWKINIVHPDSPLTSSVWFGRFDFWHLEGSVLQPAGKQQSNVKKSKILQILTLGRRRLHNNNYYYYYDNDNDLLSLSLLNLHRMCVTSAEFVEITLGITGNHKSVRHDLSVVDGWLLTVFGVLQMGFGETGMVLIFC